MKLEDTVDSVQTCVGGDDLNAGGMMFEEKIDTMFSHQTINILNRRDLLQEVRNIADDLNGYCFPSFSREHLQTFSLSVLKAKKKWIWRNGNK